MDHSATLDANELMHLALHATHKDTPDKAISYLKRLLKLCPNDGKALYLLGALHAEIGMYDQAADELGRALLLEPNLSTARFQLGLLHITGGRVTEAEAVWKDLDANGEQDPLFLFKKGLLALVRDEFEECITALRSGIELNKLNEDLNNDMRRVLHDVELAMERKSSCRHDESREVAPEDGQRMLLSLYESQDSEEL